VLRFETLTADFDQYAQRSGTALSLPSLRNHGGGNYEEMHDGLSRDLVRQIYAQDFENFGYQV